MGQGALYRSGPESGNRRHGRAVWSVWLFLWFLLATAAQAGDYTYTTNSPATNTITITGYTGIGGNVTIPDVIGGRQVTIIDGLAFRNCTNVTGIAVGTNVTTIRGYAFIGCTGLTNVSIPASVTTIGNTMVAGCCNLIAITVDALNPSYCSTDGILFNKSQTMIVRCPLGKAGTCVIPPGVTIIGDGAFESCSNLTSVSIPAGVTSIGDYSFSGCGITSVTLGDNVTEIGPQAFTGCSSLTNALLGTNVTSIGTWAFSDCDNLAAIVVDASNPSYCSMDGILFNKSKTTLIQYPGGKGGSYTVPASVTSIGDFAFCPFSDLKCITFPDTVANIGGCVLYGCNSLTNATVGTGVTNIGDYAFARCDNLVAITVDALNAYYCSADGVLFNKSQTTVMQWPGGKVGICKVPASVTYIGDEAFRNSSGLSAAYFRGNAPSLDADSFAGATNATAYYLPGTTGWGPTFDGRPTAFWKPEITGANAGVGTNQFCLGIAWASNRNIVVETLTNMLSTNWIAIRTNFLAGDALQFNDLQWTNHVKRFYRVSSP